MNETSLVHIIKDECVLMLHRTRKKNDINHDKWIGVGGKFEWGESPEECMRREVYEETGLLIDEYRYCGIVTFVSVNEDMEYMHLFVVTGFHDAEGTFIKNGKSIPGEPQVRLKDCNEGELEWLPVSELTHIPHWVGDRLFLSMIMGREFPFFSMKLVYRQGELIQAVLREHNCIVTDRLLLRPWLPEDAADLYEYARNPKIGPPAGWPPHSDVADSRRVIRDVLTRPEIYAIVLRDTSTPIGSVGLQNFRITGPDGSLISYFDERKSEDPLCCTLHGHLYETDGGKDSSLPDSQWDRSFRRSDPAAALPEGLQLEADLGYWLAEPFWHRGIMSEAANAVLEHGREHLGLARVWADYYEGNEASRKVMERAGFHFHHVDRHKVVELLGEERTSYVNVLEF